MLVISSLSCSRGSFGRALLAVGIAAIRIPSISSRWALSSTTKKEKKFHDITQGNNGSPGYTAGKGYDNDTGFGSIDLGELMPKLLK